MSILNSLETLSIFFFLFSFLKYGRKVGYMTLVTLVKMDAVISEKNHKIDTSNFFLNIR